ncbi:hypothetical protein TIFTF001_031585 [Ficus carica]|uniref:Uncharacterized protein n=1 Tax=Ficus carica TaxID=3494 RepID=A0AA88DV96_FICCA|nr:hypothetical protein TIFTF001_031585 [Ficus carica]
MVFENRPVQLRVDFKGRENGEGLSVILDSRRNVADIMPQDRGDGWKEVEMGEFVNEDGMDGSVLCSLKEVGNYRTKSGLIVEGIELRPRLGS